MKILFVCIEHPIEPLGIMYLSSALKIAGHKTKLMHLNQNHETIVKNFRPDIIAASVMTGSQQDFLNIFKKLKKKFKFLSLMGGPHPTFFPEVIKESSLDAICIGESEQAIVELANNLQNKKPITKIKNLWVKKNKKIYKNPVRPLVENLDELTFPDREIVYEYELWNKEPIKHFIATRGCPYNCTYCFNHSYNKIYAGKGKRVRYRSVNNVIQEIKQVIKNFPTKVVYFQDDTFILDSTWIKEFSQKYKKEINLPFHCHIRANLLTEDITKNLKEAGCYSVHIAIESANDRLRNEVLKRNMTKEEIYNATSLLNKYKIKTMVQNMIGLPTGSLSTALETLKMNIKAKPTYAWVSIFQPYPGTEITKFCQEQGLLEGVKFDDISSSFFEKSILKIENKKEIEHLQKLFAITVEHPVIYYSGLLHLLIRLPNWKGLKKIYKSIYQKHRQKKDNELYGIKLY